MIRIRPYQADDAETLRQIFHRAVQIGAAAHYSSAQRDAWSGVMGDEALDRWAQRLGAHITLVAERGLQTEGFMTLGRDGHLDLAYVRPEAAGTGIADALHDRVLAEARALELSCLTTDASLRAQRFFLRMGWEIVAHQEVQVKGQTLRNTKMQKRL